MADERLLITRVADLGLRASRVYAERASEEVQDAAQNMLAAAAVGGLALAFGILGLGFAHGLVFALMQAAGIAVWQICAGFLVLDALAALGAALVAQRLVHRPVLPETRRNLDALVQVIRG